MLIVRWIPAFDPQAEQVRGVFPDLPPLAVNLSKVPSSSHAPFGLEEEGIGAFGKPLPSQEEWENGVETQRMEERPLTFAPYLFI